MYDLIVMGLGNVALYGLLFFAVLTAVIFVHEMGHYLVARWLGVGSSVFAIGFGPELIGRTDKSGTRWSVRIYPLGGYVRFQGETPGSCKPAATTYFNRPVWQRSLITAAGPVANFIFAILLLACVYMTFGRPSPEPYVAALEVGTPAYDGGVRVGDVIASIDGKKTVAIEDVRGLVSGRIGEELRVGVIRDGKLLEMTMSPKRLKEKNSYGLQTERGYLGTIWPGYGLDIKHVHKLDGVDTRGQKELVRKLLKEKVGQDVRITFGQTDPSQLVIRPPLDINADLWGSVGKDADILVLGKRPNDQLKRLNPLAAVKYASVLTWKGVNRALGTIVQIAAGTKKTQELGGVIKISSSVGDMAQRGGYMFLSFVALLSVSIGLMNLLPIPMLDGGHLLFQGLEAVKGSPVSLRTKGYIYGVGLIFLLTAVFVINMNDLLRLFKP